EIDFLLAEIERRAAFPHTLSHHAKHALIKLDAALDICDGQVQMVYALDLHGRPRRFEEARACHDAGRLATPTTQEPAKADRLDVLAIGRAYRPWRRRPPSLFLQGLPCRSSIRSSCRP